MSSSFTNELEQLSKINKITLNADDTKQLVSDFQQTKTLLDLIPNIDTDSTTTTFGLKIHCFGPADALPESHNLLANVQHPINNQNISIKTSLNPRG